jgi:uncharacterized protein (DUF302 family)
MPDEPATTKYSIPEPFDEAVRSLRRVLGEAGLKITGELDFSGRLRSRLLVGTTPCLVLFAAPRTPVFTGSSGDPGVAALMPLHIVVSARGQQTEVHVLNVPAPEGAEDGSSVAVLGRFRGRLGQAIERIGMRALLSI